jgi:sugar lactone lactonase YvrE
MFTAQEWMSFDDDRDRFLPEGPRELRIQNRDAVVWVNIQTAANAARGAVFARFWDNGERRRWQLPARPGFILPTDAPDTLLVGLEHSLGTLNLASGLWTPLAQLPNPHPRTIINDGEIVPGGRAVVFGSKDLTFTEPIAKLYHFSLDDYRVRVLADEQTCSNGKVFADGGRTLFDIDTPRKVVTRYRLDGTTATDDGIVLDLRSESAFPDGMCDAGDGTVIIAFYNPHRGGEGVARHYRLDNGEVLTEWRVPESPRVTCPLLVKRDARVQLILTTAMETTRDQMPSDTAKAGSLFLAPTAFTTVPPSEVVRL